MHRSLLTTRIPGRLAAGHTAVFVHGWPDNSNVFATLTGHDSPLLDRFASLLLCDLPLCDRRSWNPELLDFETLAALLAATLASEGPLTLIAHDWGSIIAAHALARHPEVDVRRLVLMDVGAQPAFSTWLLLLPRLSFIVAYQSINCLIYCAGRLGPAAAKIADAVNRRWVRVFHPHPAEKYAGRPTGHEVNYFYRHALASFASRSWREANAALRETRVPCLFLYGLSLFHDAGWAAGLASGARGPLCDAQCVHPSHWFYRREPQKTLSLLAEWLDRTDRAMDQVARSAN